MSRPKRGVSDADRILAKLTSTDPSECWEWLGYRMPSGHGRVRAGGRKVLVHRWVFEHLVGPVPDGLVLDHLCRNPPCANPDHLEPVTQRVNNERGQGAGAVNAAKVECPKGHPYSPENTYLDYLGRRVCRTCRTAWQRAYRAKAKNRPQSAKDGGPGCPGTASPTIPAPAPAGAAGAVS